VSKWPSHCNNFWFWLFEISKEKKKKKRKKKKKKTFSFNLLKILRIRKLVQFWFFLILEMMVLFWADYLSMKKNDDYGIYNFFLR